MTWCGERSAAAAAATSTRCHFPAGVHAPLHRTLLQSIGWRGSQGEQERRGGMSCALASRWSSPVLTDEQMRCKIQDEALSSRANTATGCPKGPCLGPAEEPELPRPLRCNRPAVPCRFTCMLQCDGDSVVQTEQLASSAARGMCGTLPHTSTPAVDRCAEQNACTGLLQEG